MLSPRKSLETPFNGCRQGALNTCKMCGSKQCPFNDKYHGTSDAPSSADKAIRRRVRVDTFWPSTSLPWWLYARASKPGANVIIAILDPGLGSASMGFAMLHDRPRSLDKELKIDPALDRKTCRTCPDDANWVAVPSSKVTPVNPEHCKIIHPRARDCLET